MAMWEESQELRELAAKVISKRDEVAHVEIDQVLFFKEHETKPPALARCYRFHTHPIGFFAEKPWGIVFYWQNCDYMNERQLALLMLHELMHIPPTGNKLVQHNVQDFREVLGIDLDWKEPGREVPDILG
jgi:predicted metallopeptidase